jgi:hypothetical protein
VLAPSPAPGRGLAGGDDSDPSEPGIGIDSADDRRSEGGRGGGGGGVVEGEQRCCAKSWDRDEPVPFVDGGGVGVEPESELLLSSSAFAVAVKVVVADRPGDDLVKPFGNLKSGKTDRLPSGIATAEVWCWVVVVVV